MRPSVRALRTWRRLAGGFELVAVLADQAGGASEAKPRQAPRSVLDELVVDRSVTALAALAQALLEAHRRPALARPEAIVDPSETIDQRSGRRGGGVGHAIG
jgi:hypothetical protein